MTVDPFSERLRSRWSEGESVFKEFMTLLEGRKKGRLKIVHVLLDDGVYNCLDVVTNYSADLDTLLSNFGLILRSVGENETLIPADELLWKKFWYGRTIRLEYRVTIPALIRKPALVVREYFGEHEDFWMTNKKAWLTHR